MDCVPKNDDDPNSLMDCNGSGGFATGFLVVIIVILAVGIFLFLLPPVPGVPIYLVGGIILIAAGTKYQPDANDGTGVVMAVVVTFCVGLTLKLFACTVQQKCFGGFLKSKVCRLSGWLGGA